MGQFIFCSEYKFYIKLKKNTKFSQNLDREREDKGESSSFWSIKFLFCLSDTRDEWMKKEEGMQECFISYHFLKQTLQADLHKLFYNLVFSIMFFYI